METAAVREKLLKDRAIGDGTVLPPAKPVNGHGAVLVTGEKLKEAGQYLKAARLALLHWTRNAYLGSERVDQYTDDILEMLKLAQALEDVRCRVDAKGSLFGG